MAHGVLPFKNESEKKATGLTVRRVQPRLEESSPVPPKIFAEKI